MHTSRGIWLALLAALAWMMVEPVSAQAGRVQSCAPWS